MMDNRIIFLPRPLNLWVRSHVNTHSSIVNRGSAAQKTGLFLSIRPVYQRELLVQPPSKAIFLKLEKHPKRGNPPRRSGTPPQRGSFIELSSFPFLEGCRRPGWVAERVYLSPQRKKLPTDSEEDPFFWIQFHHVVTRDEVERGRMDVRQRPAGVYLIENSFRHYKRNKWAWMDAESTVGNTIPIELYAST